MMKAQRGRINSITSVVGATGSAGRPITLRLKRVSLVSPSRWRARSVPQYHRQRRGTGFDRYRYDPGAAGSAASGSGSRFHCNDRASRGMSPMWWRFWRRRTRTMSRATLHVNGGMFMA